VHHFDPFCGKNKDIAIFSHSQEKKNTVKKHSLLENPGKSKQCSYFNKKKIAQAGNKNYSKAG